MFDKKNNNTSLSRESDVIQEEVVLTEEQQILEKSSKEDLDIIAKIEKWLIDNRNYRDYDFTDKFKVDKIIPLINYVKHNEIQFNEKTIVQILRDPIETFNKKGDVHSQYTQLEYKSRYKDFELQNRLKGIDLTKEPMAYVSVQIAILTGYGKSIITNMCDTDANISKLIIALYFLG